MDQILCILWEVDSSPAMLMIWKSITCKYYPNITLYLCRIYWVMYSYNIEILYILLSNGILNSVSQFPEIRDCIHIQFRTTIFSTEDVSTLPLSHIIIHIYSTPLTLPQYWQQAMFILQHKYRYCMQIKASPSKALGNWQALREIEEEQEVNVENEQDVCVCVNFPNDIILCISWLRCLFVYSVVCCCCAHTHIGCFDQTVRRQQ